MSATGGPDIVEDGLVLALDAANVKSFRGEPTTNLTISDSNFTGTTYSTDGEWTPNPTVFSKSFNSSIKTPVGEGATLLSESGNNGYHQLSRWGGGEIGNHSLSCYIYPLSNDITNFTIGLLADAGNTITFNLVDRTISYGGTTISNSAFIEDVPNFPGWIRVGGNHGGRGGGWVGSVGLSINTTYTGTSGGKSFYIAGLQYETTVRPTRFTSAQTTRGTTVATGGGWVDRSGNSNHGELVNGPTYNSGNGGSLVFDAINDYVSIPSFTFTPYCLDFWLYNNNAVPANDGSIGGPSTYQTLIHYPGGMISLGGWTGAATNEALHIWSFTGGNKLTYTQTAVPVGNHNWVFNWNGTHYDIWVDGQKQTVYASTNGHALLGSLTNAIRLGYDGGTYYFHGRIYSFKMYGNQLSDNQVLQNYNATKGRFGL